MTYSEELAKFDEEWAETEAKGGGSVLKEGTYQAKVTVARVEMSSWETIQLRLTFEDLGGAGFITVWDNLEEEIGRSIAKSHTFALGWDGPLSKLEADCGDGFFDDLVCEIRVKDTVKEEKTYKAVYVNKLFGKADAAGIPAPSGADDDLPF